MKKYSFPNGLAFSFLAILFLFGGLNRAQAQIREIPVPNLPDVAMASFDGMGPVIYYNPMIVNSLHPALAKFFRLHEYGHHYHQHIGRDQFVSNPYSRAWLRRELEKEADCYAASMLSPQEAYIVYQWFNSAQGPTSADWYHPTGYERGAVIRQCNGGF